MKRFLKDNSVYYLLYLVLLAWAGYYLLSSDKVSIHRKVLTLNGHPAIDTIYIYLTYLGDGIFAAVLTVFVGWFNLRDGFFVLASYIVSGLISAGLKNYVFGDIDRPFQIWQWTLNEKMPRMEGVDLLIHNSFPSGHSTTAFAVFTCLALISNNKLTKVSCLFIAANAAFSRTYISQHWLIDIYFGSLIGLITATLLYFVFFSEKLHKLDRPLLGNKA